jgi:hypothetical protein
MATSTSTLPGLHRRRAGRGVTSLGAAAPGHQHGADHQSASATSSSVLPASRRSGCGRRRRRRRRDSAARGQGPVEHRHVGAHAGGDPRRRWCRRRRRRSRPRWPGRRPARRRAGRRARRGPSAAPRRRPAARAARDLRHRREQRQAALGVGDRLVGDAGHAACHQVAGLVGVGREVEVGEEDLARAEPRPLGGLGLLDLHDQSARRTLPRRWWRSWRPAA